MTTILSTEKINIKERFSYWNDVVSNTYAPCTGIPDNALSFNASAEITHLGAAELSNVASQGIRYERTHSDIRRDQKDDIFVSLMLEGEGYFSQMGKSVKHCVGDILIHDSAYPYSYEYPTYYRSLLYKIPRPLIEAKMMNLNTLGGTIIKNSSPYARVIRSFLEGALVIASTQEMQQFSELTNSTTEIITSSLFRATNTEFQGDSRQNMLLNRIKSFMREHLTDEYLSLERVAAEQYISVRTLSRLFSEIGETPKSWLQSQRLSCAYEALALQKSTNVTEVALNYGYKDLSYFSRIFKNHYGCSPSSLIKKQL